MKTLLCCVLFVLFTFSMNSQTKIKFDKTDKNIILGIGLSVTAYGFLKQGYTPEVDIPICVSGMIFAFIPELFELNFHNFTFTGNKLIFHFNSECYFSPYKNIKYK